MTPKNLQILILFYLLLFFSVNVGQTEGNSEVGTLLKDCENSVRQCQLGVDIGAQPLWKEVKNQIKTHHVCKHGVCVCFKLCFVCCRMTTNSILNT